MTQRETVLRMLKRAGSEGVRSDAFFEAHLPRAAARILELKDEGYEISSEREGKFVRYALVERSAGCLRASTAGESQTASVPLSEKPERSVPSMFDPDVEWS